MDRSQKAGAKKAGRAKTPADADGVRRPDGQGVHPVQENGGLGQIELKNFQKHKRLTLELDPQVTVIVGASDKGKSAVLRAVGCAALGDPDGTDLIRHDSEDFVVRLTFQDGTIVTRRRGKKGNLYRLNGQTLVRDRGAWPPEPVARAVRMAEQNFQWQLDGPLWFLDSAGTVAKQMNEVVDLEAIDAVLTAANAVAKEAEASRAGAVQEEEAAKHAYRSLKWVPAMYASWGDVSAKGAKVVITQNHISRLNGLIAPLAAAAKTEARLTAAVAAFSDVRSAGDRLKESTQAASQIRESVKELDRLNRVVAKMDEMRAAWDALLIVRDEAERTVASAEALSELLLRCDTADEEIDRWQSELDEVREKLKKCPTCPTCGRPLPSSAPTST